MSNYGWNDFWSTSPAEDLRSQYNSLLTYINHELPALKRKHAEVEKLLTDGFKATKGDVGSCCGTVPDLLSDSTEKSEAEFKSILSSLETAIEALSKKQAVVKSRLDQLKWYCSNEDSREKEYKYHEIILD